MDAMKDFVGGVVRADDFDVADGTRRESQRLPTLTLFMTHVDDSVPLKMIRRNVNVVRIRAIVAIPKQQANAADVIWLRQLNHDRA